MNKVILIGRLTKDPEIRTSSNYTIVKIYQSQVKEWASEIEEFPMAVTKIRFPEVSA